MTTTKPSTSTGTQYTSGGLGSVDKMSVKPKPEGTQTIGVGFEKDTSSGLSTSGLGKVKTGPVQPLSSASAFGQPPEAVMGLSGKLPYDTGTPITSAGEALAADGAIAGAFSGLGGDERVSFLRTLDQEHGLPENFLATMWEIESSSSRDASMNDGTYVGPFQLGPHFDVDRTDFNTSALETAKLAQANAAELTRVLGRSPTASELYLAHQQGLTGAKRLLLADPSMPAGQARRNRDAIAQNGGDPDAPVSAFLAFWNNKYQTEQEEARLNQGWGSTTVVESEPMAPLTFAEGLGRTRFNPVTGLIEYA